MLVIKVIYDQLGGKKCSNKIVPVSPSLFCIIEFLDPSSLRGLKFLTFSAEL